MYSFRKSKKGFTLIELMVVVAIIAVLALLGLRMYTTQQDKAKEAIVKANAGSVQVTIQTALVDVALSTNAAALALGDLSVLQNPFTKTTGAVALGAVYTGLTGVLADEGMVSVDLSGSSTIFVITSYGKGGTQILNYTLTAQP